MPPALRTVVVARDHRYLRALSRLLSAERALKLCGFAQDAETGAEVARAVHAELLLLDARVDAVASVAWPAATRRVLLVGAQLPLTPEGLPHGAHAQVAADRLASDLPTVIARLFP